MSPEKTSELLLGVGCSFWIGNSNTYPDFKSVMRKQLVASKPTFPFLTTLEMKGERAGEILFKATSGDILRRSSFLLS